VRGKSWREEESGREKGEGWMGEEQRQGKRMVIRKEGRKKGRGKEKEREGTAFEKKWDIRRYTAAWVVATVQYLPYKPVLSVISTLNPQGHVQDGTAQHRRA
jgi:hypothetical protein